MAPFRKVSRTTMRDVGRLAGVSVATVSAVVNGKTIVSEELTVRVRRAIRMLNYKPDMLARSLRIQKSHALGMVMPQIASPFYAEVLRGVEDEARKNEYSILIADSRGDEEEEEKQLTTLISRRVDGIIIAPANLQSLAYERLDPNLSIVLFDRFPAGYLGTVVMVDNVDASRRGTLCLIEAGHKRIAMIAGIPGVLTTEERAKGVRDALAEFGLPLPAEYVRTGSFNLQGGYKAAIGLMQLPTPPTAIFSHNHEMTLGLMRALKELDLRCPAQVSVIGFDDFVVGADGFSWATLFSPQISCIAQPSYRIGRESAAALIRKMTRKPNEDSPPETILRLEAELRVRESIGPPASAGL
ncbi:Ribose operon repressor [Acidisarcina polymorpha]|uniref:Ribose operon repressor n=1 Tax=Acidisarcina polymorpha TaxID=2211140 RepID=A0A2Z5GA94_9BACT|nr:LacI family DNA-binding transcriptional regulator [Acidisarcina polymorpha]AXC15840.1 Ribose operon repressor [Acidisarcina polymorpha]